MPSHVTNSVKAPNPTGPQVWDMNMWKPNPRSRPKPWKSDTLPEDMKSCLVILFLAIPWESSGIVASQTVDSDPINRFRRV